MFAAPRLRLLSVNCRLQPRASMSSRAGSRLKQISKHLDSKPFLELNTPFSTERSARPEDEKGNRIRPTPAKKVHVQEVKEKVAEVKKLAPEPPKKMSSQPSHPALLIPGPIEFDDAVLNSMSHYRYDISCFYVISSTDFSVNRMLANPS
jgi:alanine-glyoxylate transaminase/serine-glyoxylate transaminase/serine-pyruvate transaminase